MFTKVQCSKTKKKYCALKVGQYFTFFFSKCMESGSLSRPNNAIIYRSLFHHKLMDSTIKSNQKRKEKTRNK